MKFLCGLLFSFVAADDHEILQLSAHPEFVLELNGNSGFPNSVDLYRPSSSPNENQKLNVRGGNSAYLISPYNRQKLCLCAPSFSTGQLLQFNNCGSCPSGTGGEQWNIGGLGVPGTITPSSAPGMCVDVKDGNINNAAAIQLWQCFGGNQNQQWTRVSTLAEGSKTETDSRLLV